MSTPCPENIPAVFRWDTRVATVDVGPDRKLTFSAQLRYQQEAGELHFAEGHLGFAALASLGIAFVIVQNNTVIYRRPEACEPITVTTWSEGVRGVKFFRRYRFQDAAGEVLIDSMAVFVLVDVKAHKMLRSTEFPFTITHAPEEPHTCPLPPRLREAEAMPTVGTVSVGRSLLDFNAHLNHTRYADLMLDALSEDEAKAVTGYSILFSHEAKEGDTLRMKKAVEEDGSVLICAENGEQTCFIAQVRYDTGFAKR